MSTIFSDVHVGYSRWPNQSERRAFPTWNDGVVLPRTIWPRMRCTHCIRLCTPKMPCDSHLHTRLADIGKGGHDHLHVYIFVFGWGLSHCARGVGNPSTPVKLETQQQRQWVGLWHLCVVPLLVCKCVSLCTCPLFVAACWTVPVNMATDRRVHSSSLVLRSLGKPGHTFITKWWIKKYRITSTFTSIFFSQNNLWHTYLTGINRKQLD